MKTQNVLVLLAFIHSLTTNYISQYINPRLIKISSQGYYCFFNLREFKGLVFAWFIVINYGTNSYSVLNSIKIAFNEHTILEELPNNITQVIVHPLQKMFSFWTSINLSTIRSHSNN